MKQIVCLSTSSFHPFPTRKQQVMTRIPDAEIIYFNPPITYLAPIKDKRMIAGLKAYKNGGERVSNSITVYSLPPVLPFFNKYRYINKLNQRRLGRYVQSVMKKHGFTRPILWCYSPTSADIDLPCSAIVYDCVDRHSAYGGLMEPEVVDGMERDLAAKADAVFVTSRGLQENLSAFGARLIPNGANFELFNKASVALEIPGEMAGLKGPVFGFLGTLQDCIEYSFVEAAAKARPEWSFVFIGHEHAGLDLSALKSLSNVLFIGVKPHNELPPYIARFDVCLNLFSSNGLSKDVSPLKFFEYLATGKPIVSTPQPDQVLEFSDVIYIAKSPEEFIEKCSAALAESQPELTAKRLEYGKECSWDSRVAQIVEVLKEKGVF